MLKDSIYFGALLSLGAYAIGVYLRRRTGWSFLNPLLTAIILVIVCLLCTGMRYKDYLEDADWVSYLLTPATICLAVPLYQQVELLKKNFKAIMIGISSGVLSSLYHHTTFSTADAFQSCHLRHLPAQIHHHSYRYGYCRRIRWLRFGHCGCYHHLRCIR